MYSQKKINSNFDFKGTDDKCHEYKNNVNNIFFTGS